MPIPLNHVGAGVVTLAAPTSGNVTLTLPIADGTNGQALTTDGAGQLAFSTVGGGGGGALIISNKTSAYTVVAGDLNTVINCTNNTFTVALTAAATLGAGFNVTVWNTSFNAGDTITIDPSGAETIDGVTTLILRRGEGMQIVCNGTNWETGNKKVMRVYAENIGRNEDRPIASGDNSIAIGRGTVASGTAGHAIGRNATASGTVSLAMMGATASSTRSVAIGENSGGLGAQTVTGSGAMSLGGSYASGTDSFAAGISNNTSTYGATGANAVAIGYQTKASGNFSLALGRTSTASGVDSLAIGLDALASGSNSTAIGLGAIAQQYGKFAFASGYFSFRDAQNGMLVIRASTTNATATALSSNGSTAGNANQVILPNNSAYAFSGIIVARRQAAGGTESAAWKVEGLIRREANAASTTLVFSMVTAISNLPLWTLALSADTTNGGLKVEATGAAATNIRWVATIQTSEVTYA
jgi:hypothetical protein